MKLWEKIEKALGLVDDSLQPVVKAVEPQINQACDWVEEKVLPAAQEEKPAPALNECLWEGNSSPQKNPASKRLPPVRAGTSQWFMIQSNYAKTQFVPMELLYPVYQSMREQGLPDQSVHTTDCARFKDSSLSKFKVPVKSKMNVLFDGLSIQVAAEDLPRLRWKLLHAPQREINGTPYYKIHGTDHTICLTPEQLQGLTTTLKYKLEKANQLTAQDYSLYNQQPS